MAAPKCRSLTNTTMMCCLRSIMRRLMMSTQGNASTRSSRESSGIDLPTRPRAWPAPYWRVCQKRCNWTSFQPADLRFSEFLGNFSPQFVDYLSGPVFKYVSSGLRSFVHSAITVIIHQAVTSAAGSQLRKTHAGPT